MSEEKDNEGTQGDEVSLTLEYLPSGEPRTHLRSGRSPLFTPSPPAPAEGTKAHGSPTRPKVGPDPLLLPSHSDAVKLFLRKFADDLGGGEARLSCESIDVILDDNFPLFRDGEESGVRDLNAGGCRSIKFNGRQGNLALCPNAARWCIVLCNKGILHLGARGHQEAPVHQRRGA
jgi:hypothetical protein